MKKILALVAAAGALLAAPARAEPVRLALTFDDLPAHGPPVAGESRVQTAEKLIAALKAGHVPPVYGFINAVQMEREPASSPVLDLWRASGNLLGNHTWSHSNLNQITPELFEGEIAANEPILARRMAGADWRWLRYPFLAEGDAPQKRAEVRAWLAAHRYHVASVTTSFDDWAFSDPYARCVAKGDQAGIAELERRYMDWAAKEFDHSTRLSQAAVGRQVPLVQLMHEGPFTARMLPRLLEFYRSKGVQLIGLDEAERDPFYAADYASAPSPGPTQLEAAAREKGVAVPPRGFDPAELGAVCR